MNTSMPHSAHFSMMVSPWPASLAYMMMSAASEITAGSSCGVPAMKRMSSRPISRIFWMPGVAPGTAWHITMAFTSGSEAKATSLEMVVSVSDMKLSGYVSVMMCSGPYFSSAFSAARNSSSPWLVVPVRMATFQVPSSAVSAEAATVVRVRSMASANTMLNSFFMLGSSLSTFRNFGSSSSRGFSSL